MTNGIWYAVGAYLLWGILPIYWKWISHVSALELIAHRIVWSCLILGGAIVIVRQWTSFTTTLTARVIRLYALAALFIAINWFTYVWAVNTGRVVHASLGYFINPLISVVLGVMVLGERLRPFQWMAVGLAALGVLYLTLTFGVPPWISLTLASSFGVYGLVKKTAPLGSIHGLTVETAILLLPAIGYLVFLAGDGAFFRTGVPTAILIIGTGLVTAAPLLLFASAVQRVPLSQIGLLQYIAPTMQLLLGVFLYREPFTRTQLIGFSMVWAGLIVFGLEGFLTRRQAIDIGDLAIRDL
ncbi:MAG TPA: EamA family transporter RarD [Vicinamibacterales bacterium]|jgi:chloramphenicol-sensitive protein RarD